MERVHLIGKLVVWAVVSVVPVYFVFLFASSGYRDLKQRHAKLIEAKATLAAAPTPKPAGLREDLEAARCAYNARRRTVWGAIWGRICGLPPADGDSPVSS